MRGREQKRKRGREGKESYREVMRLARWYLAPVVEEEMVIAKKGRRRVLERETNVLGTLWFFYNILCRRLRVRGWTRRGTVRAVNKMRATVVFSAVQYMPEEAWSLELGAGLKLEA